nr:MAG TPA: hypothetical protein [Caudoviricetes sp.]
MAWLNLMYGRWHISPLFILVINADINNKKKTQTNA